MSSPATPADVLAQAKANLAATDDVLRSSAAQRADLERREAADDAAYAAAQRALDAEVEGLAAETDTYFLALPRDLGSVPNDRRAPEKRDRHS